MYQGYVIDVIFCTVSIRRISDHSVYGVTHSAVLKVDNAEDSSETIREPR